MLASTIHKKQKTPGSDEKRADDIADRTPINQSLLWQSLAACRYKR
jgi:hypothetical protein